MNSIITIQVNNNQMQPCEILHVSNEFKIISMNRIPQPVTNFINLFCDKIVIFKIKDCSRKN